MDAGYHAAGTKYLAAPLIISVRQQKISIIYGIILIIIINIHTGVKIVPDDF